MHIVCLSPFYQIHCYYYYFHFIGAVFSSSFFPIFFRTLYLFFVLLLLFPHFKLVSQMCGHSIFNLLVSFCDLQSTNEATTQPDGQMEMKIETWMLDGDRSGKMDDHSNDLHWAVVFISLLKSQNVAYWIIKWLLE